MTRILAVDVGNSRIKLGLFRRHAVADGASELMPFAELLSAVPLHDNTPIRDEGSDQDSGDLKMTGNPTESGMRSPQAPVSVPDLVNRVQAFTDLHPDICVLAGSNPPVRDALAHQWPVRLPKPVVITRPDQIRITVDVDQPERVGIDRLLTASVAEWMTSGADRRKQDETYRRTRFDHAVIVDSGTATTINLATWHDSTQPVFRGGCILPGIRMAARALHRYTARLPFIDPDVEDLTQCPVPARNTRDAILSGLFLEQLGAVREISARLEQSAAALGCRSATILLLTGGGGRQLREALPDAVYVDSLALYGLTRCVSPHPAEPPG